MEIIIASLGSLLLWSIVRPGWVYESSGRKDRRGMPTIDTSREYRESGGIDESTLHYPPEREDASLRVGRTVRTSTVLLDDYEQAEAARALRHAVRKR